MKEKKWSEMDKLEKRLFIDYVRKCFQISLFLAIIIAFIVIWTGIPDVYAFIIMWIIGIPLLLRNYKKYKNRLESGDFREQYLIRDVFLTTKPVDWDEYMRTQNG